MVRDQVPNAKGLTTGAVQAFTADRVKWLRAARRPTSLRQRLRAAHPLTARELAAARSASAMTR